MYDANTTARCEEAVDAERASDDAGKKNYKILAVDDDPEVIQIYQTVLARAYSIRIAATGKDALQNACNANAIDLVILEYKLSDMCGFKVLRELKKAMPSVPVIFVTSFGEQDIAVQAFRLGARDYIKKPFNIIEMHKRIEFYLMLREKVGYSRKNMSFEEHHHKTGFQHHPATSTSNVYKIQKAIMYIDDNYMVKISRGIVAQKVCMSQHHFSREFKRITGLAYQDYLSKRRIEKAKELLSKNRTTVTEAALSVGYSDLTHFERIFKKVTGYPPSHHKKLAALP